MIEQMSLTQHVVSLSISFSYIKKRDQECFRIGWDTISRAL